MPCIGDLQCRLCARRKRQTRLCKLIDLHFDGQKHTGIGFRLDVHNAVFIQYPLAQINRVCDFNVTNRVVLSLKDNIKQTDERRARFFGVASVDAVKDIVMIKRHARAVIQTRFAARRREASKNTQTAIYDLCFV